MEVIWLLHYLYYLHLHYLSIASNAIFTKIYPLGKWKAEIETEKRKFSNNYLVYDIIYLFIYLLSFI